jgi:hypothetical protein
LTRWPVIRQRADRSKRLAAHITAQLGRGLPIGVGDGPRSRGGAAGGSAWGVGALPAPAGWSASGSGLGRSTRPWAGRCSGPAGPRPGS